LDRSLIRCLRAKLRRENERRRGDQDRSYKWGQGGTKETWNGRK
jgi:hypothetical protein